MKHIFTLLFLTLSLFANLQPQITYSDQHQPLVVEYANGETITYTYDEAGNITHIETPTQTISKTYDALNRLTSVTDDQGTTTYAYDAIGRQTQITYPNGVTTSYTYDSRNRVTKIEHKKSDGTILQSFAYTYDAVGNRTQVVENTGRKVEYTYNEVNQLTKEIVSNDPNGNNTTTTFTYDDVGNLVTKTIDGISESYTYNANDQLTAKGSVTYTYDPNGNLIDDDTNSYEYDSKNRLVKVTTPTQTIEYTYDAEDHRIAKIVEGSTTTYLIDTNTPFAQVITESKENGTEVHYTYGNGLLSDGSHTFLTDALGSTRGLVDNSEQLTDSYSYTPYGTLSSHEGTSENSFLFTGEQWDSETDNYYLRARYYDPAISRFLSRDTYDGKLNDPLSQNHYLYAGGNPVMYVDPSGHFFGGFASMSLSIMSTIVSGYPRIAGTVERGTALAINAYFVRLGMELRNEALTSIIFLLNNGGSKEAMDAAYKKYYYSTQIISSMANLTKVTQSAIGWAQASASFAGALSIRVLPSRPAYKALSTKIGGGVEKIVQIQSRKMIQTELDELAEWIVSAARLLNKGRGLAQ